MTFLLCIYVLSTRTMSLLVFVFTHAVVSPKLFTRGCNNILFVRSCSFSLLGTSPNFIAAQVELCTHSLPDCLTAASLVQTYTSYCEWVLDLSAYFLCRRSFHQDDPVV